MESSSDKQWASKHLLDHSGLPAYSQKDSPAGTNVPSAVSTKSPSPSGNYPTPPTSASPTRSSFHPTNPYASSSPSQHRQQAFGSYPKESSPRRSSRDKTHLDVDAKEVGGSSGRQRKNSLDQRFPGDMSHRPLQTVKHDHKAANRSPHLKKRHMPGADIIDTLDGTGFSRYHHEGPYDATLLARNTSFQSSPLEALRDSNNEALKATPRENIQDSLTKHVPLQGTAIIPSGELSHDGSRMSYKEGADLMREEDAPGGAYKRYDFIKYHPEDLKGKGEPSFTIDRALKGHEKNSKTHRRIMSDGNSGYEMQARSRPVASRQRSQSHTSMTPAATSQATASGNAMNDTDSQSGMQRSNTTGRSFSAGLKSRFGSLRRSSKKAVSP